MELKGGWNGLDHFQLKCLGLAFMTVDHVGAFVAAGTLAEAPLRILGRIAAPLFLYLITEGIRHTHSRGRMLARLWAGHIAIQIITCLLVTRAGPWFGDKGFNSILGLFAYVLLYIWILESAEAAARGGRYGRAAAAVLAGAALTVIPTALGAVLHGWPGFLRRWLLPSVLEAEYSPLFVLLGVCWYFCRSRRGQALWLAAFSALSAAGAWVGVPCEWLRGFFAPLQVWMILYLPFLLCYNGRKGRPMKTFFYVYYPLHAYALMALGHALG